MRVFSFKTGLLLYSNLRIVTVSRQKGNNYNIDLLADQLATSGNETRNCWCSVQHKSVKSVDYVHVDNWTINHHLYIKCA